jgi:hypothetical protein
MNDIIHQSADERYQSLWHHFLKRKAYAIKIGFRVSGELSDFVYPEFIF